MDEGDQVGVVVEVPELVLDIPVVDVDGHGPGLEAGDHGLDVLGAVLELDADVVAAPDACRLEVVGQAVGALLELGVGEATVAAHQCLPLADHVGQRLEDVGQVEVHSS